MGLPGSLPLTCGFINTHSLGPSESQGPLYYPKGTWTTEASAPVLTAGRAARPARWGTAPCVRGGDSLWFQAVATGRPACPWPGNVVSVEVVEALGSAPPCEHGGAPPVHCQQVFSRNRVIALKCSSFFF